MRIPACPANARADTPQRENARRRLIVKCSKSSRSTTFALGLQALTDAEREQLESKRWQDTTIPDRTRSNAFKTLGQAAGSDTSLRVALRSSMSHPVAIAFLLRRAPGSCQVASGRWSSTSSRGLATMTGATYAPAAVTFTRQRRSGCASSASPRSTRSSRFRLGLPECPVDVWPSRLVRLGARN